MSLQPTWQRGDVQLYLGDCQELLPQFAPGSIDAVVTDPPYGIGADVGQSRRANRRHGNALAPSSDYGISDWDGEPVGPDSISAMRSCSAYQIIFGGNYFDLPPARCWLVWDKLNGLNDYADCELAWTNLDKPVRRIVHRWHGMLRDGNDGNRVHPTQKPSDVMAWCIGLLPADVSCILDPFMGSGTTGVAAVKLGRKFIGIEISEQYFDIAVRRISDAQDQFALFDPVPPPVKQAELFGGEP